MSPQSGAGCCPAPLCVPDNDEIEKDFNMPMMAPPPLTPILGTAPALSEHAALMRLPFQTGDDDRVVIVVSGAAVLSERAAQAALKRAKTLSDAIYELAQGCHDAGYPAAQLLYARSGDTVYVQVELHGVAGTQGPTEITRYFDDIDREQPLTMGTLERRRLLASFYTSRANLDVQPKLIEQNGQYQLDFKPSKHERDEPIAEVEFGNPGNRFVGRYFVDTTLRYSWASGDEVLGDWNHGLTGLGGSEGADSFNEENLAWSRATTYGVFGLSGRNLDYRQHADDAATGIRMNYKGEVQRAQTYASLPVLAGLHWRWLADARIDYTDRQYRETTTHTQLLAQQYESLQLAAFYFSELSVLGRPLDLSAGFTVRKGLRSDDHDPLVMADLGYTLIRPEFRALLTPTAAWRLRLEATLQWTGDALPGEEQWNLGGFDNVQAYLPGVAAGDSGGILRLQGEYRPWQIGPLSVNPVLFTDYAYARLESPSDADDGGTQSIAEVGAGLMAKLRRYEARMSIAEPLGDKGIATRTLRDSRANLLFSLKAAF